MFLLRVFEYLEQTLKTQEKLLSISSKHVRERNMKDIRSVFQHSETWKKHERYNMCVSKIRNFTFSFDHVCWRKSRPSISHGMKDTEFLDSSSILWCLFPVYKRFFEHSSSAFLSRVSLNLLRIRRDLWRCFSRVSTFCRQGSLRTATPAFIMNFSVYSLRPLRATYVVSTPMRAHNLRRTS